MVVKAEDEHDIVRFWLEKDKLYECLFAQYFVLKVIGKGGPPDGRSVSALRNIGEGFILVRSFRQLRIWFVLQGFLFTCLSVHLRPEDPPNNGWLLRVGSFVFS